MIWLSGEKLKFKGLRKTSDRKEVRMIITGALGSISGEGEVLSGKCREPLKEDSGTGGLFMQILGTLMACSQDAMYESVGATYGPAPKTGDFSPLQIIPAGVLNTRQSQPLLQLASSDKENLLNFDGFKDSGVKQQLEVLPEPPAGLLYNLKNLEEAAGGRSGMRQALETGVPGGDPVCLEDVPDEKALSDSEKLYTRFPYKCQSPIWMPELRPGGVQVKALEEKPLVEYQPVKATRPESAGDLASAALSPGLAGAISAQANVVDDVPLEQITRVVAMKIQKSIEEGQQKVNLQLKLRPSHLGDLTIKIYLEKGGELKAHFYTDNSAVRDIIEATLNQLKDTLAAQRLLLQEAAVFLGDGSGNFGRDGWMSRCFEAGTRLPGPGNQVVEDAAAPAESSFLSNSLVNYLI